MFLIICNCFTVNNRLLSGNPLQSEPDHVPRPCSSLRLPTRHLHGWEEYVSIVSYMRPLGIGSKISTMQHAPTSGKYPNRLKWLPKQKIHLPNMPRFSTPVSGADFSISRKFLFPFIEKRTLGAKVNGTDCLRGFLPEDLLPE